MINYWRLLRPRQWVKSGFVFIGLLFANAWRQPQLVKQVLLAVVAFSLTASGVYILNDLFDREQDRNHPGKQRRPLAAQTVSTHYAVLLLIAAWTVSFLLGYMASQRVLAILLIYVLLNIAYSVSLQHIVLLDVFVIATGFMLRILAGT